MKQEITMPIAVAEEIAHLGFIVTDLDIAAKFITDFGMQIVSRSDQRLYARGTGIAPFVYFAQLGQAPGFAAFGIRMNSRDDLDRLARHDGLQVEPYEGPGGGSVVRLTMPDGFRVEAVAGQTMREPEPIEVLPVNQGGSYPRVSRLRHSQPGPSRVLRLGHGVFAATSLRETEAWFKDRFGMLTSDEIRLPDGKAAGVMLRWDRGDIPVDHHALFLMEKPAPLFHHAAYEVLDIDDLMRGQDHLRAAGYRHHMGVGRHQIGSQIFDYWFDPFGFQMEHWTDGDCLVREDGSNILGIEDLRRSGWGEAVSNMARA
jgi:catechol 2,3-dioxygenase-like lactoylglutathione lyase family enzyme